VPTIGWCGPQGADNSSPNLERLPRSGAAVASVTESSIPGNKSTLILVISSALCSYTELEKGRGNARFDSARVGRRRAVIVRRRVWVRGGEDR
jgi:hypothetical protein